jgi:Zn-finger nucleic acid-binding protein
MRCDSCGAPLLEGNIRCAYCGTVKALEKVLLRTQSGEQRELKCPRCKVGLELVHSNCGVEVDICPTCKGIWLDNGELESLINSNATAPLTFDTNYLEQLDHLPMYKEETVTYIPCPHCSKIMNRRNHGARSGVILDACKDHGIWLDAGELNRILHWHQAGGSILHQQLEDEKQRIEEKQNKVKAQRKLMDKEGGSFSYETWSSDSWIPGSGSSGQSTILDLLMNGVALLFKSLR